MRLAIAALAAAFFASAQAAPPRYTMTVLGDLPGGLDLSVATDISDSGVVVGYSHVGNGSRAFVWDAANGMRQLFPDSQPKVSGEDGKASYISGATVGSPHLNNTGLVVGRIGDSPLGFIYSSPDQPLKIYGSVINAVNDKGQFASVQGGGLTRIGYVSDASNNRVTLKGLTAMGNTSPHAMNESGQVAGSAQLTGGYWDAVIWDAAGNPTSLQARSGVFTKESHAVAINESGVVAGFRYTDYFERGAFIWSAQTGVVDLGAPAGAGNKRAQSAVAINDSGVVIGDYGSDQSFYWTQETGMLLLNDLIDGFPAFTGLGVTAINKAGQIVGSISTGSGSNLTFRAVVLTPVPEPGALALLGVGVAAVLVVRYRRTTLAAVT